jgi:hypothetical protein
MKSLDSMTANLELKAISHKFKFGASVCPFIA